MVTVTPHLHNAIGVMTVSEDVERGVFTQIIAKETPVPCRRAAIINAPKSGGDVVVKFVEAERAIKVTKPEPKPKANGAVARGGGGGGDNDDDEDDDEDDEDDDEPEEVREKAWKVRKTLAEAAVKGVKKGGKVEVTINVAADMNVQITAREVGGKGGIRGTVETAKGVENGSA